MNNPQRVLVTGSAGRIGRAAVKELTTRGFFVIGFDRGPTPGIPDSQSVVGLLSDTEKLMQAAENVDCLIHLAAAPDDSFYPPTGPDNFLSELVPSNIVGPYAVLETARLKKIPRVILASTGQVIDGYIRDGIFPVTVNLPPRPRYLYACTKVFLESLGQVYAKEHGFSVLAVRLGWCPRDLGQVAEIRKSPLAQDVFLSPGDAGRFFATAVEAPQMPKHAVVYVTSRFTHNLRYDLIPVQRICGFAPKDQWPAGAEEF